MNRDYFISLFEYDKWANKQLANTFSQNDNIPSKCLILLHHMCAATETWLSRVTEIDKYYKNLFEETNPELNSEMIVKLDDKWVNFLRKMNDINLVIKYKNTKGEEFQNNLADIVTQVLTHNHYHRGQINQLLRQNNLEPVLTDYIFYKRQ